jgi:hypothetical protein
VNRDLVPTAGARLLLELAPGERNDAARAAYRAAIYTPGATYEGRAELADDGSSAVHVEGAPAELAEALAMFGKLTARAAAKRRADGLPPWPARVLRWRGPGRGE